MHNYHIIFKSDYTFHIYKNSSKYWDVDFSPFFPMTYGFNAITKKGAYTLKNKGFFCWRKAVLSNDNYHKIVNFKRNKFVTKNRITVEFKKFGIYKQGNRISYLGIPDPRKEDGIIYRFSFDDPDLETEILALVLTSLQCKGKPTGVYSRWRKIGQELEKRRLLV